MNIIEKWNKNKFTVYNSDEKTVLHLLKELYGKVNGLLDVLEFDIGNVINIDMFPRLMNETDDAPRFQRAFDFLKGRKGSIILNRNEYYFKTLNKNNCFVTVYPNISLIGCGGDTLIYTDNESENNGSVIFKCLDMYNATYKGFDFETKQDLINDNSFYDLFYFRYDNTKVKNVNINIKDINSRGYGWQAVLNIGVLDHMNVDDFGEGLYVENCTIMQQGYSSCIHNTVYKNVHWFVNLDVLKPSYINSSTQTPIKFSGRTKHLRGCKMEDCKITCVGTRLPFNPVQFTRVKDLLINNLVVNSSKNGYVVTVAKVGTDKVSEYGKTNEETTVTITNSHFNGVSILTSENGNIVLNNCLLENNANTIYGAYEENLKETDGVAKSTTILKNCIIKDSCNRLIYNTLGDNNITFDNCIIYYDRSKSPNGGFNVNNKGRLSVLNSTIYINGSGGTYLLSTSASDKIEFTNTTILNGDYKEKSSHMLYLTGSHNDVIFINTINNVLQSGNSFLQEVDTSISNKVIINSQ